MEIAPKMTCEEPNSGCLKTASRVPAHCRRTQKGIQHHTTQKATKSKPMIMTRISCQDAVMPLATSERLTMSLRTVSLGAGSAQSRIREETPSENKTPLLTRTSSTLSQKASRNNICAASNRRKGGMAWGTEQHGNSSKPARQNQQRGTTTKEGKAGQRKAGGQGRARIGCLIRLSHCRERPA